MTESILFLPVCQHVSSDEHATMSPPFRDRARGSIATTSQRARSEKYKSEINKQSNYSQQQVHNLFIKMKLLFWSSRVLALYERVRQVSFSS
mmetsp:Transcript_2195/g.3948  ORF Transcript_2195/g.3948 Transcript_2195/m.3948 type:complete len:92 (+) Transcript_2195:979-1254(+)